MSEHILNFCLQSSIAFRLGLKSFSRASKAKHTQECICFLEAVKQIKTYSCQKADLNSAAQDLYPQIKDRLKRLDPLGEELYFNCVYHKNKGTTYYGGGYFDGVNVITKEVIRLSGGSIDVLTRKEETRERSELTWIG